MFALSSCGRGQTGDLLADWGGEGVNCRMFAPSVVRRGGANLEMLKVPTTAQEKVSDAPVTTSSDSTRYLCLTRVTMETTMHKTRQLVLSRKSALGTKK